MDLLHAADCGRLSLVKQLVENDRTLLHTTRHKDSRNRAFNVDGSPIHYACRSGHLNVVEYLLNQDSSLIKDVDIEAWTPLHYACYNGHLNIVKLLLKYNPNVNLKDSYLAQTPIQFAMYKQFEDVVRLLDENQANETVWKRRDPVEIASKGNTPVFRKKSNLFLARYILKEDHVREIESFRKDPNYQDIELKDVQDVELNQLNVRLLLTHDFNRHMAKTSELSASNLDENNRFVRSSTTSTNEHIIVIESSS